MTELQSLQESHAKMEVAKRKQDSMLLQQIVEPLAEAIEELSETIKEAKIEEKKEEKPEPDYFDKDLNKNVTTAIDKVFVLLQKFKQPNITVDLSPVVNQLGAELKKGNDSIASLLNKFITSNNSNPELEKLLRVLISNQNNSVVKLEKQIDYSAKLDSVIEAINSRPLVEKITVEQAQYGKTIITPIYKK